MIASHTNARIDRLSQRWGAGREVAVRRALVAGRLGPWRRRPAPVDSARSDGDVVKVEATQLHGTLNVVGVEELQASNHLARPGKIHLVLAAQP
jgi:hypothetical protein